jgi:hypothetical protein
MSEIVAHAQLPSFGEIQNQLELGGLTEAN